MERVSFPLLSAQDIFADLRCLQIQFLTDADVVNPRAESIREIYSALLEVCLKKPRFEILKPKLEQLRILRQTELHERTTELIGLFSNVRRLLDRIGCQGEFKLNDFFKPDFKRHRRFLSAIINFIKFRTQEEEMLNAEENLREAAERTKAEYQHVKAAYERAQNELENLQMKKLELAPAFEEKKQKILDLTNKIAEVDIERSRLEAETESLQESIEDVGELSAQVKRLKEELDRVNGVVRRSTPSTDKSIIPIEQLKELLDVEKHKEGLKAEPMTKKKLLEEVKVKLMHAKLMLESYLATLKRTEALKLEMSQLQNKLSDLDNEANMGAVETNIPNFRGELRSQRSRELILLQEEAVHLQAKLREAQLDQEKLKADLRAGEELLRNFKQDKERTEAELIRTQQEYLDNYRALLEKVTAYRKQVESLVQAEGLVVSSQA